MKVLDTNVSAQQSRKPLVCIIDQKKKKEVLVIRLEQYQTLQMKVSERLHFWAPGQAVRGQITGGALNKRDANGRGFCMVGFRASGA